MTNIKSHAVAKLCAGKTIAEIHDWVNNFNLATGFNVNPTEVVLEMNRNGAKIPTIHQDTVGMVKATANYGSSTANKIDIGLKLEISIAVPMHQDVDTLVNETASALDEYMQKLTKLYKSPGRKLKKTTTKGPSRSIFSAAQDKAIADWHQGDRKEKIYNLSKRLGFTVQQVRSRIAYWKKCAIAKTV